MQKLFLETATTSDPKSNADLGKRQNVRKSKYVTQSLCDRMAEYARGMGIEIGAVEFQANGTVRFFDKNVIAIKSDAPLDEFERAERLGHI